MQALELPNTVEWARHIEDLFDVMKSHRSMRAVKFDAYPVQMDPDYKWLQRLLKDNRLIVVKYEDDSLVTDDGSIIRRL